MLIYVMLGLAALVALLVSFVATRPGDFRITRSTTVAAPAGTVFAHVNELRKWDAWSPWAKLDPDMKQTFVGPAAGVGATQRWSGNAKVGEGSLTITESRPGELVRMRLEFLKPFKCTNAAEFSFTPAGSDTVVTWTMTGRNGFVSKAFCLCVNMDKMCGGQFEQGLAQLKAIAEANAQRPEPQLAA